ncbi:MAG: type VI secretion system baseplate subunit TssE [Nitrospinota bacterium]|nr:MAG: type VI secretion system baseplate subunit TssE [Nitrospinota bacterium]
MARINSEMHLVPSVLDRLLDDEPEQTYEPIPRRFQNLQQLIQSVTRDLEWLLNTRQETLSELPSDFKEVRRSLLVYGLPDFTAASLLSPTDRHRIRRALEQTIATFEPRLQGVHVTLEEPHEHERNLHFRIEALLRTEPAPEPVTFDAILHLHNQEYVVQRKA